MSWPEAKAKARAGVHIRRPGWATGTTLVYSAGLGTAPAVAVIVTATAIAAVKNSEFGAVELTANDWTEA